MSDVAEVKEALAAFDAWGYASGGLDRYEAAVVDAARRWVRMVSDSQEVQWCETHKNGFAWEGTFPQDTCWAFGASVESCSMVVAAVGVEKDGET